MTLEGCVTNFAPPGASAVSAPTAVQPSLALNPPIQKPLMADESDPNKMSWMQDFPPSPNRTTRFDLAGNMFPRTRYGYGHIREFVPTRVMWRGDGPVSRLPCVERGISGALLTDPSGTRRTLVEALKLAYTDGILVMHKGKVIYERCFDALDVHTQHIAMSITKLFVGTLATILVADGKLDPTAPVTQYVSELKGIACGDTTVRQMVDMTVGVCYSENYADPNADVWVYTRAGGIPPRPADYKDPDSFYGYLTALRKEGEHDAELAYKTVNAETLTWITQRASNKSLATLLSERIWQPMGVQDDAHFSVGSIGTESGGGDLNTILHDLARSSEMVRNDGRFNGRRILSKSAIDDIRHSGDSTKSAKAGYATPSGHSYRNVWWVSGNDRHTFETRGIRGQRIYIDPVAQMTAVRYASHPITANVVNDPVTHHAYAALTEYFM